jgi:hypothetical protein
MGFNPKEHMIQLPKRRKNAHGQWETVYAEYLEVKWRIVWFREDKPAWTIDTNPIKLDEDTAIFKAEIRDEEGRIVSVGHGSETKQSFNDYIEKAETRAIGRALAVLGYGTQFAPELDEESHIADAPVEKPKTEDETINKEQAKKLFELAPEEVVIESLKALGYESSLDVKKKEYPKVQSYIQQVAQEVKKGA